MENPFEDQEFSKWYQEISKEIAIWRETYFKSIIDFLKWTTTFSLAAILWIATYGNRNFSNNFVVFLSLTLLAISLIVAISIVYFIVFVWGSNWKVFDLYMKITMSVKLGGSIEQEKDSVWDLMIKHIPQEPKYFNNLLLVHLTALIFGIFLYTGAVLVH